MKGFTIGTKINQTYGHGDSGRPVMIVKAGTHYTGDFPPIFLDEAKAQAYLDGLNFRYGKTVVPVEIVE